MWHSILRHRLRLRLQPRRILPSAATTAPPLLRQPPHAPIPVARIHTTRTNMASDDDAYAAFLRKSQKDYSAGSGADDADDASPAHVTNTPQIERNPHPAIRALGSERFYTSDVDEAFEPISLVWTKESLPTGGMCSDVTASIRPLPPSLLRSPPPPGIRKIHRPEKRKESDRRFGKGF